MCKRLLVVFTLLFLAVYSSAFAENESEVDILKKELSVLNVANPEADVDKNIGFGDRRFVAIYGYTYEFPGIEQDVVAKLYGFRAIEGTSDMIESDEHGKLISDARKYAETYNRILLEKLTEEVVSRANAYMQEHYKNDTNLEDIKKPNITVTEKDWLVYYGDKMTTKTTPSGVELRIDVKGNIKILIRE